MTEQKSLTLQRFAYAPVGTFGYLHDDSGKQLCLTVEEVWHDNRPSIPGVQTGSCIPEGRYRCRRDKFPTHGTTFEVTGVPGRSAILFHIANTIADVEGCIGVGERLGCLDGTWAVLDSGPAFRRLMAYLAHDDEFDLLITRHPGAALAGSLSGG